ncbi:uncharacterized protein [Dermacentor andersoni]|uniref:uncharacterized protein n=1 Tax=Dermacentor andersoni TaxID=34620 RepID=UPI003B3AC2A8
MDKRMLNIKATSPANLTGTAAPQPETNVTSTFNTTEMAQKSTPSTNETTTECSTQPSNSTETTVSTTEMVQNSSTSNNNTSTEESTTQALSSTQTAVTTTVTVQNSTASIIVTSTEETTTAALSSTQTPVTTTAGATGQNSSICRLDPEKGRCRASFGYWYFNYNTSVCTPFTYGGCEGNGNRFENCTECMETCNDGPNITETCLKLEKEADEDDSWEIDSSPENTTDYYQDDYEFSEE